MLKWPLTLAMVIAAGSFLAACSVRPFVGVSHLSDPRIENDGFNLVCAGAEYERGRLAADLAACRNVAPNGGAYALGNVRLYLGE